MTGRKTLCGRGHLEEAGFAGAQGCEPRMDIQTFAEKYRLRIRRAGRKGAALAVLC